MSVETSTPRSRRAVLAAALGGLGAVIASRIAAPGAVNAADHDAVLVGEAHVGATATTITTIGTANAIVGHSDTGAGLMGASDNTTPSGFTGHRTGVIGLVGNGTGIAATTDEVGVYGFADLSTSSAGVWGDTADATGVVGSGFLGVYGTGQWGVIGDVGITGTGVYGFTGPGFAPSPLPGIAVQATAGATGTGVYGFSGPGAAPVPTAGVGVEAAAGSVTQVALNVKGKVKFSRSGRTAIAAGRSARKITMAGVTTSSYIIATLQTRRAGVYVHAVVPAAGSFTIYLNKTVSGATAIGFLVIN